MFTLVAFTQSVDQATIDNINAAADQHVRTTGVDLVVPPELPMIVGMYAIGVSIVRARITTPRLRQLTRPEIIPVDISTEPVSTPPFVDNFDRPLLAGGGEILRAQTSENGAGATRMSVGVWLSDGKIEKSEGEVFNLRATGTTTLVAYAWTAVSLTLDDQLPTGYYRVVGLRAEAAGLVLARLIFPGLPWRPGTIGFDLASDIGPRRFRNGEAGVWGEFSHLAPPVLECLSDSADTAETITLDVVGPFEKPIMLKPIPTGRT